MEDLSEIYGQKRRAETKVALYEGPKFQVGPYSDYTVSFLGGTDTEKRLCCSHRPNYHGNIDPEHTQVNLNMLKLEYANKIKRTQSPDPKK